MAPRFFPGDDIAGTSCQGICRRYPFRSRTQLLCNLDVVIDDLSLDLDVALDDFPLDHDVALDDVSLDLDVALNDFALDLAVAEVGLRAHGFWQIGLLLRGPQRRKLKLRFAPGPQCAALCVFSRARPGCVPYRLVRELWPVVPRLVRFLSTASMPERFL